MLAGAVGLLAGCGGGGGSGGTSNFGTGTTTGTTTQAPARVTLRSDVPSVKSDSSNSATITVAVQDAGGVGISGAQVRLSTTVGQLSLPSDSTGGLVTTGDDGTGTVTFIAGGDTANSTAVITAAVPNTSVSGTLPVAITGSSLTVTSNATSAITGTPITLTATATNSAGTAAGGQTVSFSVAASSTGSGTLSTATATTNNSGVVTTTLTGTAGGVVTVQAQWLDRLGVVTSTATSNFTVTATGTTAFTVTAPVTSPLPLTLQGTSSACTSTTVASGGPLGTDTCTPVTVNVPATVNGVAVRNVLFATSLGTWQSNNAKAQSVPFTAAGSYTQTIMAGASAGLANVQISALNASGATIASVTRQLVLSAGFSAANPVSISLQPAQGVIPPSSSGASSTTQLIATVRDAANNPVSNAPVLFELVNPTGGGEQVSPVVVMTGDGVNGTAGVAQSTFTAGTQSTTQQSQVRATVVGSNVTSAACTSPVTDANGNRIRLEVCSNAAITVSGTAGSVVVGLSTTITDLDNSQATAYQLPVSVLVSDSNGNPVPGAVVSVSAWPVGYFLGVRGKVNVNDIACTPHYASYVSTTANPIVAAATGPLGSYPNEDVNENLILDPGEDTPPAGNGDGSLTPPASSAGTVPSTVITGADGTATFNWVYLKTYANWLVVRLRLSTVVQGTERTTETTFGLSTSAPDLTSDPCVLGDSPFNP